MTDKRHGTLYTGVSADLPRRSWEHREGLYAGFTKRYGLKLLVWYEHHDRMDDAIAREKQIKSWKRAWKIELIEKPNPTWRDLYEELNQ
jgi:putative endonuclease